MTRNARPATRGASRGPRPARPRRKSASPAICRRSSCRARTTSFRTIGSVSPEPRKSTRAKFQPVAKEAVMNRFIGVATLAALCCAAAPAQQSQAPAPQAPAIKSAGEEVLLDVVVRDKKGRAVNDLKPEDFQVLDNGEPKKILSFRLVQGQEAVAAGGSRTPLDPLRQIRLLTMIFQNSNNDARRLARDAALELIKSELPQNVYLSVMTI